MHCWAELGSDGSISRLGLVVDFQKTFGTGLTPDIDRYIDTSRGATIAAKDLESVYQQVFKVPESLDWKDTNTYASPSFAYHHVNYFSKEKVSRVVVKDSRTAITEFRATGNFPKDEVIEDIPKYSYSYNVSNDGKATLTITSAPHILSKT